MRYASGPRICFVPFTFPRCLYQIVEGGKCQGPTFEVPAPIVRPWSRSKQPGPSAYLEAMQEAVSWLKEQAAELQKAAEPHINAASQYAKKNLEKAHVAAAPYLQQASDVLMPYYQVCCGYS